MSDNLITNLIDEISVSEVSDDSIAVEKEDTLTATLSDLELDATLNDNELSTELEVGTFREYDYNKLENKPRINGVLLKGDKSAEELGIVPIRLSLLEATESVSRGFRNSANIFVEKDGKPLRMTLRQVKAMGTKIVAVNNVADVDFQKLDEGDYIYTKN